MARRKNAFLSDGSDSGDSEASGSDGGYNSQEDADSRAERALFEYNGSKRRKMAGRGKAAAWEGIFGEDEQVDNRGHRGIGSSRGKSGRAGLGSKSDITQIPSFVTADKSLPSHEMEQEVGVPNSGGESQSSGSSDSESGPSSPSTRSNGGDDDPVEDEEAYEMEAEAEQKRPTSSRRGIGARGPAPQASSRPGLGGRKQDDAASPGPSSTTTTETDRTRQRFVGAQSTQPVAKATPLTSQELRHFQSINGTYGSKLLQKFGWSAGEGLGKDRAGRAVPIETGRHLKGQGIASGIRSEDSKREARRRGEKITDDDDEERPERKSRSKGKHETKHQDQSWRKQRKVKVKVEHKTYEQLVAEAGDSSAAGVGLVIDARGGELREVQSLAALDLSGWTPTGENAQIPELRHNLRLVTDVTKVEVSALAREGRTVNEKRRWAQREQDLSRAKADGGRKDTETLRAVQGLIEDIAQLVSTQSQNAETSLTSFAPSFNKALTTFKDEYQALDLDHVVVGAIAQITRPLFVDWDPFGSTSDTLLAALLPWQHAYRLSPVSKSAISELPEMTAWESLLWTVWLPKVRSAFNNHWSAKHPRSAVHLLESWAPLLPAFVVDNILDQLVLPKLRSAIEIWDGRPSAKSHSLSGMVFPWLPLLGHRLPEVLDLAKRRLRHMLRKWVVRDGVPLELLRWRKDIFSNKEWDELMLRNVVPKLGNCLRDDFHINPRQQDLEPLKDWVLPWADLLRLSTFSQLLEVNFFPKWLDILYIWLVQPNFKADEVANWFTWWKTQFSEPVQRLPGISHGFTAGLDLMQQAMRLGDQAPSRLVKPSFEPLKGAKADIKRVPVAPRQDVAQTDITFRSLAEQVATENDLVFFPVGRSHDQTGKPLFKVSKTANGKGGITVYIGDDAVFALAEDGRYRAVTLDDMVKLASAS